ncbi:protein CPR-5-like [Cucumis melo var. makuwa]|uniref:Protein CPR-5-like n=2 Tax=Cucumis melo TaxID=3656 RepID=A0A5A7T043_CUCMM|nr:protein CPR-5-like [Cucumis melo var. makuwa]
MNESSSSSTNSTVVEETSDNDSNAITKVGSSPGNSSRTHDDPPPRSNSNRKKKKKKKKMRLVIDVVQVLPSSPVRWRHRGVDCKRRRPKAAMAQSRRINGDIENAAFLLGTSLAAFVTQVLEKQEVSDGKMCVDHLSVICTSAIRESLVNVFGVKLDCFLKNFESSFVSTLRTPRSNTKASAKTEVHSSSKCKEEKNPVDLTLDKKESYKTDTHVDDQLSLIEDVKESVSDSYTQELPLCKLRNDMVSFIPWPVGSYGNEIAVGAFERLVVENARSNDLKEREIDLKTQNLKLKETQMNLNCESNNLKAEKLKNQLENKRHSELLETCIDCLVAGFKIMVDAKSYGIFALKAAYVKVSSSSCESDGVWCDYDSCNCLLAFPTLHNFNHGNASYFHHLAAWSCLRFSWKVVHRHTRRKRVALAHGLGDLVLDALSFKRFYVYAVSDPKWPNRCFSREKSPHNLAILVSPCCIPHYFACVYATVMLRIDAVHGLLVAQPLHSAMDEPPTCATTYDPLVDETTDDDREDIAAVYSSPGNSTGTLYDPPPCSNRNRKKKKKKKKRVAIDNVQVLPSSSSSCSSPARLLQRGVNCKRRRPKVVIAQPRRIDGDFENVALLLGMSFAAFVAQVLERQDMCEERMPVDHLSVICTSGIRESLVNVFGDKLDWFLKKFESSFGSTLRTLRSISEASARTGVYSGSKRKEEKITVDSTLNRKRDVTSSSSLEKCVLEEISRTDTPVDQLSLIEDAKESVSDSFIHELALCILRNDEVSVAPRAVGSHSKEIAVGTFERSIAEQARSNDLKTVELGLQMKKLKLKERQIALNCDLNNLERSKLAMGISKASFKAEKFKNQVEDTRHSELLKKCIDCLVAGLLIMSVALSYGAYVYSYHRISEATAICTPSTQGSKSWWMLNPMASLNSGWHVLRCQVQVVSRMAFGVIMILAIAYLLLQRSATSNQAMPITFIVLLLGGACGLVGKLCIDTLGGSGYHWLMIWETLCLLHLFANIFTSALFLILHGPIEVSQPKNRHMILPYWFRRVVFYTLLLVFMPLLCGLIPFAGIGEWKDHFCLLVSGVIAADGY